MQSDTIIVVGAASRGIIQRGHESTAAMYKTYYAPNPFDNITEEDVEEYKEEIQRKTRGEGILSCAFYDCTFLLAFQYIVIPLLCPCVSKRPSVCDFSAISMTCSSVLSVVLCSK